MSAPVRAAGVIPFRLEKRGLRFLMLRSSEHGDWGFPKGHLDPGEDDAGAARREFREETGLSEYRSVPDFRALVSYSVDSGQGSSDKTVVYFTGEAGEERVRLSAEHDQFAWLEPAAAMARIPFENLRRVLAGAVAHLWLALGPQARSFETGEPLPVPDASLLVLSLGSVDDRWVRHAFKVSGVCAALAERLTQAGHLPGCLFAAGAGLLHDVGRALDHDHHGLEGCRLLAGLGLFRHARVSGVHWSKGRDPNQLREDGFLEEDRIREMDRAGLFGPLSLEEKTVCVADAVVAGDRMVTMEERFRLARKRYGDSAWMRRNEALSLEWKNDIEIRMGCSLPDAVRPGGNPRE